MAIAEFLFSLLISLLALAGVLVLALVTLALAVTVYYRVRALLRNRR